MKASSDQVKRKLSLRFGGKEIIVGERGSGNVVLGRADDNDVVIKGKLISRVHARIECSKNHFTLIDESTNGTFVQREDGEEFYVRRDKHELSDSGTIGLGKAAAKGSSLAIEYEIL
jgi:pSer/pThr/pTyr-binding forkhead associated (FHA) protein